MRAFMRVPHCEHSGEFATNQVDREQAIKFSKNSLQRARALEKIAPINSQEREFAEAALDTYLPRALHGLLTLSNKIDGLQLKPEEVLPLQALLLSTFDKANSLWRHPSGRARPRQLSTPPKYRENNIWFALEQAAKQWGQEKTNIQIMNWPDLPTESGGITIFEGRMKEMLPDILKRDSADGLQIEAIVTAFPRPNQAFWTLSALWTGWLWGQEALGKFGTVLRRRRYDWSWHTKALHTTLGNLEKVLEGQTPFFGLVTESEAGFDAAVMIAAELANFRLQHWAVRPISKQSQFEWTNSVNQNETQIAKDKEKLIKHAAKELIQEIGQPIDYLRIQATALDKLIYENQLINPSMTADENYTELRSQIELALSYGQEFSRYGGGESSIEGGKWWLAKENGINPPLDDRLEREVISYLQKNPGNKTIEIERQMCNIYPGSLTPARELIASILESYGNQKK